MRAIEAVARTVPITSRLAALGAGALRGRCFRPTHHTTPVRTAGPAIAHCQPPVWMMSAPSVGPDAPPMVVHADHNVMALTRSFAAVTTGYPHSGLIFTALDGRLDVTRVRKYAPAPKDMAAVLSTLKEAAPP